MAPGMGDAMGDDEFIVHDIYRRCHAAHYATMRRRDMIIAVFLATSHSRKMPHRSPVNVVPPIVSRRMRYFVSARRAAEWGRRYFLTLPDF